MASVAIPTKWDGCVDSNGSSYIGIPSVVLFTFASYAPFEGQSPTISIRKHFIYPPPVYIMISMKG